MYAQTAHMDLHDTSISISKVLLRPWTQSQVQQVKHDVCWYVVKKTNKKTKKKTDFQKTFSLVGKHKVRLVLNMYKKYSYIVCLKLFQNVPFLNPFLNPLIFLFFFNIRLKSSLTLHFTTHVFCIIFWTLLKPLKCNNPSLYRKVARSGGFPCWS